MAVFDVSVINLGRTLVKLALSLWLGDVGPITELSNMAIGEASQPTADAAQRRKSFRRIRLRAATQAAERLQGLLAREFVDLPANEQRAAIEAVSSTLDAAALDEVDLFVHDLDGERLRRHLRDQDQDRPARAGLSTAAETLYDRLLSECCQYLVEAVRAMPGADLTALTELLRRQTRLGEELREFRDRAGPELAPTPQQTTKPMTVPMGASLAPPIGTLPARVRGRDEWLTWLRQSVSDPPGKMVVLAGLGGVGKSTIALELIRRTREHGPGRSWWISAATNDSFTDGWIGLAEEIGANHGVREAIRAGNGRVRDVVWRLLEHVPPGWLLVIDNLDDPGSLDPCDGTGWLRSSARGLVLITSRVHESRVWGSHAEVRQVETLTEAASADVLLDLAPQAGTRTQASRLAQRLGGLPLALQLAGSTLGSPWTEWSTFVECGRALDAGHTSHVLVADDSGNKAENLRAAVVSTWELSLDVLADRGLPHCRPLLRLMSCYAPSAPVRAGTLVPMLLRDLVGSSSEDNVVEVGRRVQEGLAGLARHGLVKLVETSAGSHRSAQTDGGLRVADGGPGLTVHPVVAEISRIHLTHLVASERAVVQRTAVELIAHALEPLRWDDHRGWSTFQSLSPHVEELLDSSAAGLAPDVLARLLTVTSWIVAYRTWSGAECAAERLAGVGLDRAHRLGEQHPATLRLRTELAWAIGRNDRWDEAEPRLRGVLKTQNRVLGDTHPDTLDTRHKWAWAVGKRGDWTAAERILRRVLADRRQLLGVEHPDTLHSQCCYAWAIGACGQRDEAEGAYRELLALRTRVLGEDHLETLDTGHSLAEALIRNGRNLDGEKLLRQIIVTRSHLLGPDYPETMDVRPHYWLAVSLLGQGRHVEAYEELRKLLATQIRNVGPNHPTVEAIRRLIQPIG